MKSLVFEGRSWLIYEELRQQDKRLHKNLCAILKEMLRDDPTVGLGKPEALRHNLIGFWSRRLSQKDRLIYKFDDTYTFSPLATTTISLSPNKDLRAWTKCNFGREMSG